MVYIGAVVINKKDLEQGWPYVVVYGLLIVAHGYLFGSNDQMDFMPYARHLQDPGLFASDFYIQCISGQFNERWLIAHFVAAIPHRWWPVFFILIHFSTTLLLLAGMKKWAAHFIRSMTAQWTVILVSLIVLYHRNLGGNELYYNMLTASNLAKSISIWALWYAYNGNAWSSAILVAMATYIHPMVGAQVFILSIFLTPTGQKLRPALLSLLFILPYLLSLAIHIDEVISDSLFTEIMYIRNAHHFFPARFGIINYLLLTPIFLIGSYRFGAIDRRVATMLIVILSGCGMYAVGMMIAPKYAIMTQWFKTTIWLKYFCVLAVVQWVTNLPSIPLNTYILKPNFVLFWIVLLMCGLKLVKNYWSGSPHYQLPWRPFGEEENIARTAKSLSYQDDVFLVPPDYTAFKYFAERATFVDWKALPHNGACLGDWWQRISKGYGLTFKDSHDLSSIYLKANLHLNLLSQKNKQDLKSLGITYLITVRPGPQNRYAIEKL